jgi:hypothetical protein
MNDNLNTATSQIVADLFKATTAVVKRAGELAKAGEPAAEEAHQLWEAAAPSREHLRVLEDTVRHLHGVPEERNSDLEGVELIGMVGAWADENEKAIRAQIADHGHLHMSKDETEHFIQGFAGVQEMMRTLLNGFTVKVRLDEDAGT